MNRAAPTCWLLLLPLLTGCHWILPLDAAKDAAADLPSVTSDLPLALDSAKPYDAFVAPGLKCSLAVVVGEHPTHGLREPFISLDGLQLCATRFNGDDEIWCGTRTDLDQKFDNWAREDTLDVVENLRDHTWVDDKNLLVSSTGASRRIKLCQPAGKCVDVEFLDAAGQPLLDVVNDMDGPSAGMLDGKLGMVFNTSDANTVGTEKVWLGRPLSEDFRKWKATPVADLPLGTDDPGISRDGRVLAYEGRIVGDGGVHKGEIWISYRDPDTGGLATPQKLTFDQVTAIFSPEVYRHGDGTVEVFVGGVKGAEERKIYGIVCQETWP